MKREPAASGFVADPARPEHRLWWELHRAAVRSGNAGDGRDGGENRRETVCLLNGLAMHTKAWYPFLDELAGYDVLLHDYLGQGASSSPDEPMTIPGLADGLAAVLDAAGVAKAHVLGVSYGGFVALEFARLHGPRVETLTLSGILLSHERQFELYQANSLRFYAGGRAFFPLYTHYLYEKIFGERFLRATPPETLEEMRRRFEERYVDRIHSLVRLTEAQIPFFAGLDGRLDEYRRIAAPALVLAGEDDRCIPIAAQRKLAALLPRARFELVPESGHVIYLERGDLFFPRWRRFLATRDPAATEEAA